MSDDVWLDTSKFTEAQMDTIRCLPYESNMVIVIAPDGGIRGKINFNRTEKEKLFTPRPDEMLDISTPYRRG